MEVKEQKEKVRRLENQSIATELRIQEVTAKLNALNFEQEKQERRTKLLCKGTDFELLVRELRLSQQPKMSITTQRRPEELLRFLQESGT